MNSNRHANSLSLIDYILIVYKGFAKIFWTLVIITLVIIYRDLSVRQ